MILKTAIAFSALCLFAQTAWAGSLAEDGTYTSSVGYTVNLPKDWTRIDKSTANVLKNRLPKNVNPDTLEYFDAIFFPAFSKVDLSLKADDERIKENKAAKEADSAIAPDALKKPAHETLDDTNNNFSPVISIQVTKDVIKKQTPEYAVYFKEHLLKQLKQNGSSVKEFDAAGATLENISGTNTFKFNYTYVQDSITVAAEQYIMLFSDRTSIITCTINKNDYTSNPNWCLDLVKTYRNQ